MGAEHLHYAYALLYLHFKFLLCLIFKHGHVPDNFCLGISVPLLTDKTRNVNDVNNYRAITLTPVISKGL
jgi:hypothetical protein